MAATQTGLFGMTTIANPQCGYQSMNIFVPERAVNAPNTAIYFAVNNGGWMASYVAASVTDGASFDSATGNVGAALKAGYVYIGVGTRSRGVVVADGSYPGKAPAPVVDAPHRQECRHGAVLVRPQRYARPRYAVHRLARPEPGTGSRQTRRRRELRPGLEPAARGQLRRAGRDGVDCESPARRGSRRQESRVTGKRRRALPPSGLAGRHGCRRTQGQIGPVGRACLRLRCRLVRKAASNLPTYCPSASACWCRRRS